jgi:hypothetical protein
MKKIIGRYPKEYNGPRSGSATAQEWAAVRDYQAYKWIIDGTWAYSDFDNYLYSVAARQKVGKTGIMQKNLNNN